MRLKFPITAKLTLLVALLVVATAFAVNMTYMSGSNKILTANAITGLENETNALIYPLQGVVGQMKDDAQLVSRMSATRGLMRALQNGGTDPETKQTVKEFEDRLTVTFREMLGTRASYAKIRIAGVADAGREILTVERFGNQIEQTPQAKLQKINDQDYFRDELHLDPGQVYLSEAELNKENDKVTRPYLLVLRASVPLYTQDKEIFGAVVINMDLGQALADVKAELAKDRLLYITNDRGDYLVNPDPSKLYATDLGGTDRIQKDNPKVLAVMGDRQKEQATFLPADTAHGDIFTFRKFRYDPLNPERYLGIAINAPYRNIIAKTQEVERNGFIFSAVISLLAVLAAMLLLRLSIRPLNAIADAVQRYRRGEEDISLPEDSPDEIGVLAREFRAMMDQKTAEDWVKGNLVEISRSVLGFKSLKEFANALMQALASATDAQVGAFYLSGRYDGKGDGDVEKLALLGGCGYTARDGLPQSFRWGEGMVGQCARDRKIHLVRDMPEDYLSVASALGAGKPRAIILLPILFENTLVGVIELASLGDFTQNQRALLEQVCFNIGVIVNSISAGVKTQELLEEARQTAEELQRSEEELKTQQEELEAANEEMEQRAQELESLNKQIKEGGERLRAVVDSALDGIIAIDERGTVQNYNAACERLFGYKASEVIGQNIKMLMPEPYHSEHDGYLERYNRTGDAHIIGTSGREVTGRRKDGSTFPMDLSVSSFELSGKRYFSGTVRDITQRKEAEERVQKYQEGLRQSSQYKSEFLANMSHELRTPLNSLLILARGLAGNEEGNLTEEQVEEAQVIHNSGLELLSLISDILDLSKVEAGKLNVLVDDAPLSGILHHMEQQFEPIAREKGVALKVEREKGLPDIMQTDAQRVEQILKNLLSNAFKFTEKGTVTLKVGRPSAQDELQQDSLDPAATIAFSVIDTGIGIGAEKLNDIFEAFQQEDGSTDRHYGGTGLGLTIARKFAHMLGGEIHVASKKGEGSAFTLMLPETLVLPEAAEEDIDQPPEAPPAKQAGSRPPARRREAERREQAGPAPRPSGHSFIADDRNALGEKDKTLLIIEDDPAFAKTLMKIARGHGYKCVAAGDGKSGILLASELPVDAIILDLMLPDIDGITVLGQLKHDLRTRHLPVHVITGRDDDDNGVIPLRKGAVGYLTKPVLEEDMEGVFRRIEGFLQSSVKKILIVEDDKKSQTAIQRLLKKKDVEITCAETGRSALQKIADERFDCIILDLMLPDMTGFEWLDSVEKQTRGEDFLPVIVYTAKELTEEENRKLNCYTGSIVIKGVHSSERLLDEVTLFLHSVEATLSKDQLAMIRMQHNPDKVLEDRTVLLVDDDLRNTFALSKVLKKHGMNVIIADNGQMALDKLESEKGVELVIMDIMMPVMDGYEAIRTMRGREKWKNLPVIALTARAMQDEQEKCMEAGANDYMTKPVDIERLLSLLRVWLFRQTAA
ncbi:MAG: response regulator [Alphaproteobacteria bacterium]|nr:response regulator [Alphaproteobacteria bacterium]